MTSCGVFFANSRMSGRSLRGSPAHAQTSCSTVRPRVSGSSASRKSGITSSTGRSQASLPASTRDAISRVVKDLVIEPIIISVSGVTASAWSRARWPYDWRKATSPCSITATERPTVAVASMASRRKASISFGAAGFGSRPARSTSSTPGASRLPKNALTWAARLSIDASLPRTMETQASLPFVRAMAWAISPSGPRTYDSMRMASKPCRAGGVRTLSAARSKRGSTTDHAARTAASGVSASTSTTHAATSSSGRRRATLDPLSSAASPLGTSTVPPAGSPTGAGPSVSCPVEAQAVATSRGKARRTLANVIPPRTRRRSPSPVLGARRSPVEPVQPEARAMANARARSAVGRPIRSSWNPARILPDRDTASQRARLARRGTPK